MTKDTRSATTPDSLARIAEDEKQARLNLHVTRDLVDAGEARLEQHRVLADCRARRQVIEAVENTVSTRSDYPYASDLSAEVVKAKGLALRSGDCDFTYAALRHETLTAIATNQMDNPALAALYLLQTNDHLGGQS